MNRGAKYLISAAGLGLAAGCSQPGTLEVRSRPTAIASANKAISERLAEARGHYALGNVALALEAFRKASRDDPQSIAALTGMAACYEQMGRPELSRAKYEDALALAPTDPVVLGLLEASLRRQGNVADANQLQREIAGLADKARVAPSPQASDEVAAAEAPASAPAPAREPRTTSMVAATPAPTPLRPARALALAQHESAPAEPSVRLERLSLAEVALVTVKRALPMLAHAQASAIGVAPTAIAPGEVRILNAARIYRLAARTSDWLSQRGWPRVTVADAEAVKPDSVIYYPANKLGLARRLAFELGFATVERNSTPQVTVVLGRDVVRNGGPGVAPPAQSTGPALALKADGAAPSAWTSIARAASHAIEAGRLEQGRAMIGRAVTAGSPSLVTSRLVADLSFKSGDFATAAGLYEALMKTSGHDQLIVERAGMARAQLGQYEAAARHLDKATSAQGASWQAWNARGIVADASHDWATADAAYRRARFLAPRSGEVLNNAGWSLALRGRWSEARDLLEQAVYLDPGMDRASRNLDLARMALDQRLPSRGAHESESAWAAQLNDAGVVAQNQGNVRKALAAFARAIEARSQWFERAVNNLRLAERKD